MVTVSWVWPLVYLGTFNLRDDVPPAPHREGTVNLIYHFCCVEPRGRGFAEELAYRAKMYLDQS